MKNLILTSIIILLGAFLFQANSVANVFNNSEPCEDDAGQMGSALKSVCGDENVYAPAEGVIVSPENVHVYLLHDGTGTIIYDSSSDGTFVNDCTYPTNVQLSISSVVGPPSPDGIPDLNATCSDIVLPGCPVIFYDPVIIITI